MRKIIGLFSVLILLTMALTVAVFAENVEYFYADSQFGDDGADGLSAANAVKTFTQACRYAEKSGADKAYIVITNEYAMPSTVNEIAHTVPFVITTNDGTTDYAQTNGAKLVFGSKLRYVLKGDTTFEKITIEYTGTLNCVAQYNHITFGDNVVTKKLDGESSGLYVVGGWQSPENSNDATLDSHITIKSGSFLYVIGGSRQRANGADGLECKGTHYIDIQGGEIVNVLGASAQHNWSQNAVITMSGGKVDNFSTGGDATRRLNGSATVTLTGGEIGTLNINNVVGNATVNLFGTKVGSASITYANAEIEELRTKAKSKKTLVYDALYYTDEQISALSAIFDVAQNSAVIYVKDGANGDGKSAETPTSYAKAFETAVKSDAVIELVGNITLTDYTENAHEKEITVTSQSGAKITVSGVYTLAGETVFDGVTLAGNGALFNAENGKITVSEHSATSGKVSISGNAELYGGKYDSAVNAGYVIVNNTEIESIIGGNKDVTVEIIGGEIKTVKSTETAIDNFTLRISGGEVQKVVLNSITKKLELSVFGGKIYNFETSGTNAKGTLTLGEGISVNLGAAENLFIENKEKVFFVCDGGIGSGISDRAPASSLDAAYAAIGESGGTIVVCGPLTIAKAFNTSTNKGKIIITSVYGGVDYQKTNNAKMIFSANFYLGGDTEFNNITLKSNANYRAIYANAHTLLLGDNIITYPDEATNTYISVMGGSQAVLSNTSTNLTINSGIWQRVRGGSASNGSTDTDVNLVINGGEFLDIVTLGSTYSHGGNINCTVNGGTFYRSIYAATLTKAEHWFSSNVTLTLNGGSFYGNIAPANSSSGVYYGKYTGTYTLNINGGDFSHITEILGTNVVKGMTSTLNVSPSISLDKAIEGTYSFTNPIRDNGADPWLFYCDGYYYYTATTGSTVGVAKAANIGDLKYAEYKTIYDPEDGHEWSRNLWSPEIHYYTDEEIGEGNGGWYLFMACDNGDNVNHRMYVAKCLDGDNILGRWGNPITGEVNFPQRVEAKEIPGFDDTWAAGMSEIRINGKLYMLYITEAGRETADMHQTVNIVEMTNPWTIVGQSKVICRSEYDWEKGGYAYNATSGKASPMVVEGSTAVYAEDGSVYIIYSGSGYWTVHYNLAQLKYIGGDPLEITSWKKSPEPILYKSDSINGCGHASYVTDTSGQGWVCYHAYIGKDTSSGRYAFVEPYFADKNGVVIADGSGHPAPIETVYTVNVNPLPLGKRIRGFDAINAVESKFVKTREYDSRFTDVTDSHWFASYVKNAYELKLANGTSATKFSPDNTFIVAQALTAAANIHTVYYGKAVRAAASGEAWYVPYVEYCVQNGIIKEGQFADVNANITRGDMAVVFANVLPESEYGAVKSGSNPDVTSDMACFAAVAKLYKAGIVGGDSGTGNYRPNDSIKRSEACVIFTRIALKDARAK
ncbi:MAG: family 43 glycosylhydrolase [Clostridia bacterium]|nr:family 43 glycosylhydrolase [Clostridia bacterium]